MPGLCLLTRKAVMISQSMDRFFAAVGAKGPVRVDVTPAWARNPQSHDFDQPFLLVGSCDRADLVLNNPEVSRRQLYLQVLNGRLFAVHLSYRIPTFFGDEPLPAGWVAAGRNLTFGPYSLSFPDAFASGITPSQSPLAAGSFAGPPVTIEMTNGRPGANRAVIDRVLTLVGNEAVCKLRINSSRVSAVHCSLVRTPRGLWVVDLASREGVLVNGAAVRAALLGDGDVLELGGRYLEVHYSAPPAGPGETAPSPSADGDSFSPTEIQLAREQEQESPPESGSAPPSDATALVQQFAAFQAQTHQQFQETIDMLVRAFGNMFAEHREFVDAELSRLDDLVRILARERTPAAGAPAPAPQAQPAAPAPPAAPADSASPDTIVSGNLSVPLPPMGTTVTGEEIHAWLQQRIEELGERKSSLWDRMSAMLRAKDPHIRAD
jgi:pSer/pThr/pTyr-binding forkhead associated (FHA) protein